MDIYEKYASAIHEPLDREIHILQHARNQLENQLAIAIQEAAEVERELTEVKATTEQSIGAFAQFQRLCFQAIMNLRQEVDSMDDSMSEDGPSEPVCIICHQGEGRLLKCSYTNCSTHFHKACALNTQPTPYATEHELDQPKFFCTRMGANGKPACRATMEDSSKGKRGKPKALGTP